jgi:deoxyribodipyrimidine photo-lyase
MVLGHIVDADLANNTLGWQWTAGCGADAGPYFRVFNPVLQGRKFDSTAHTSADGSPNWPQYPTDGFTSPSKRPHQY